MPKESCYNELKITFNVHKKEFIDLLTSLGIEALEERNNALIVRSSEDLDVIKWGIEEFAKKMQTILKKDITVTTTLSKKLNEDWIQKYKKSIRPVQAGNFYIHPSWEASKEEFINIIIDPALAFGSGHHESTYGCLIMLEKYLQKNDTLLDVGCGSGILSIASLKLGARVDCCDTDELAVSSTLENMKLNSVTCNASWVGTIKNDKKYNVVVANIIADILIALSQNLIQSVKKNGYLILSGILLQYEQRIYETFSQIKHIETLKKNEWYTIIFQKG